MFNRVLITPLTQVYYTPIFSEAATTVVFNRLTVLQIFLKTHRKTPKKRHLWHYFSYKYCKISQNIYFIEHLVLGFAFLIFYFSTTMILFHKISAPKTSGILKTSWAPCKGLSSNVTPNIKQIN